MYGFPKTHKENFPMRPIISSINTPTYELARNLSRELKRVFPKTKYSIDNSFELKKLLNNTRVPPNHIMVSFDAKSLFTNVTITHVIETLEKRSSVLSQKSIIPPHEIIRAIQFLYNNNYFTFDNKIFRQKDSSPMGSPISPIVSDFVLEDLETFCLNSLKHIFKPIIYVRYVHDIFTIIPENMVFIMLNVFNAYDLLKRIQFTYEIESEFKINYLDITIIRDDEGNLMTDWYRKNISSGRTLNFESNQPIHQKRAVIFNMVDRAIILSNETFHKKNLEIVKNTLILNNYPKKFIDKYLTIRFKKLKKNNFQLNNNKELKNKYKNSLKIPLPYQKDLYEDINKIIKPFDLHAIPRSFYDQSKIVIKGKDKTTLDLQTNSVYKINCKQCPASYVGESKRRLFIRKQEHQKNYNNVINGHCQTLNHTFDFKNTSILETERNRRKRKISEMIYISLQEESINLQNDTKNLHKPYTSLIKRIKQL